MALVRESCSGMHPLGHGQYLSTLYLKYFLCTWHDYLSAFPNLYTN